MRVCYMARYVAEYSSNNAWNVNYNGNANNNNQNNNNGVVPVPRTCNISGYRTRISQLHQK